MYHFVPSYDVLYNTGSALYVAPWARMSPYVVGVFFGWLLAASRGKLKITEVGPDLNKNQGRKHNEDNDCTALNRQKQYRRYWILACIAVLVSMHSTFKRNFPYPIASTVMVMVRLFVAWAACWTIIATSTGYSSKYDWVVIIKCLNLPAIIREIVVPLGLNNG